ncbi:MAG: alpha/beta hydrolase [Candidatus Lindowbacteria bacterium]|nr:alpha/beta hydrolase [Candidatus Lindowbacteria bacterium]
MKVIEVSSRRLFFKDVQPAKRAPLATLLLVHGAGGSHLSWRRQLDELSDKFRIIALDLPGHGLSEGGGEVTIRGYCRCVLELMELLQLQNVVLGGHSMGGAIALEIALMGSNRVGALLLVGTGGKLRVLPAIFSIIREDFEVAVQGVGNLMFGSGAPEGLVEEEKQLLAKNSGDIMLKDFTACDSFDAMGRVGSVTLPTLIICGKEDRLTPPKYSEFLHEKIAGSEAVFLEKCGHMPMLEQADEFNASVSSFLMGL